MPLDCVICWDVLYRPASLPCGHVFCEHCIDASADQAGPGQQLSCPVCRSGFNLTTVGGNGVNPIVRRLYLSSESSSAEGTSGSEAIISRLEDRITDLRREKAALVAQLKDRAQGIRDAVSEAAKIQAELDLLSQKLDGLSRGVGGILCCMLALGLAILWINEMLPQGEVGKQVIRYTVLLCPVVTLYFQYLTSSHELLL